jgi:type IV pilus assembly protein PilM
MSSILSKTGFQLGGRPPAAVEVVPEGVLAAALPGPGQAPAYAFEPLPDGAVVPGIAEANLRQPEAVAAAIRSTLGQLSPRTRSVTLVVPDTAVRVFVLDFDSLPSKAAEAFPVLRFRLRKMIPFDVEHAGLSYQVLVENEDECKVLAAVMPGPVLAEYEGAVRAAGYEPGAVLPSSLAALEAVDPLEAVLIANLSSQALTTCIATGQDLLLYRTIELPADPNLRLQEVQRGIAVASAYYEDKLGVSPRRLLYAGNYGTEFDGVNYSGVDAFALWLDDPELTVEELAPRPETGAVTALGDACIAGVAGALALSGGQGGAR